MRATGRRALASCILAVALAAGCGSVHRDDDGKDGGARGEEEEPGEGGGEDDDGGDDGAPAEAELCVGSSGERIRRLLRQHEDGTSEAIALRDVEMGGNCEFRLDREGTLRCMPDIDGRPFQLASREYTDSACSESTALAMFGYVPGAPPGKAVMWQPGTCGTIYRYYDLGASMSFPAETPLYYKAENGTCTQTTASTSPTTLYFALGPEIPLDRFVAGSEAISEEGRLGVRRVTGEDGAVFCDRRGSLRDAELGGHPCAIGESEDGVLRCLPRDNPVVQVSTEPTCAGATDAAQVFTTCDAGLGYTRELVESGCYSRWRMHELGAQVAGTFYLPGFDTCELAPADRQFHEIGAAVDPSGFAELAYERVPVGGRLERVDVVGDGVRLDRPSWYDTELEVPCEFRLTAGSSLRCLPGTIDLPEAGLASFHTDPLCKSQSAEYASFGDPCMSGRQPRFVMSFRSGGYRAYELGRPVEETLYTSSGDVCSTVPSTVQVFTVGAEMPVDRFVAGIEVVEP